MVLPLMAVAALAAQCAPTVAPSTLLSIARVESGFDPLAIGVNRPVPGRLHPGTPTAAAALATRLIASGADIDLGIAQINSKNLGRLGLTIAEAFDPCANLAASAQVIAAAYLRAASGAADPQAALRTALSYYNTGDPGSITTVHADSAALAFEQLTLLVKESEGGRDLARDDIRALLHLLVDVVVQMKRVEGRFRITEVRYEPVRKRALAV